MPETIAFVAALLLVLAGLVLVVRTMRTRRSSGPACPACGYAMRGVEGLRCPECGRVAASRAALARGPARWRRLVIGAVLVAVGASIPTLLSPLEPWTLVPDGVLIAIAPSIAGPNDSGVIGGAGSELARRVRRGHYGDSALASLTRALGRGGANAGTAEWGRRRSAWANVLEDTARRTPGNMPALAAALDALPPAVRIVRLPVGPGEPPLVQIRVDRWSAAAEPLVLSIAPLSDSDDDGGDTREPEDALLRVEHAEARLSHANLLLPLPGAVGSAGGAGTSSATSNEIAALELTWTDTLGAPRSSTVVGVPARPAPRAASTPLRAIDDFDTASIMEDVFALPLERPERGGAACAMRFRPSLLDRSTHAVDLLVGIVIEIVRDDRVVRRTELWWEPQERYRFDYAVLFEDREAFAGTDALDARWRIRVRGDELIARRALTLDAHAGERVIAGERRPFWDGMIEIETTLRERRGVIPSREWMPLPIPDVPATGDGTPRPDGDAGTLEP